MAQYKLLQIKEKPGGNVVKICKVDQTTCTAKLLKQGYFLYLCTPVYHLLPQLTVYEFQIASGGNELREKTSGITVLSFYGAVCGILLEIVSKFHVMRFSWRSTKYLWNDLIEEKTTKERGVSFSSLRLFRMQDTKKYLRRRTGNTWFDENW